jgi:predicted site-specific integrase-resolvase
MIVAAEIQRFRADYCLAQAAAQILGISRSTLSRWEVQGRVAPVYGKRVTPQAGFSLYRRQDLQQLIEPRS